MQGDVRVGFTGRDALELLQGGSVSRRLSRGRTHLGGAGGEEDADVIWGDELGVEFLGVQICRRWGREEDTGGFGYVGCRSLDGRQGARMYDMRARTRSESRESGRAGRTESPAGASQDSETVHVEEGMLT